jgi:predicted amino acid-binding ACT domain protein
MDIKDILSVGLTAEDFDVLLEGLDSIPEKGMAQEIMRGTMTMLLTADSNPSRRTEMQRQVKRSAEELQKKADGRKEDLVILKSKLILLKRLLLSNDAIRQANEILTPPHS